MNEAPALAARRRTRAWVARGAIVTAVVLAASVAFRALPKDQSLVFRAHDARIVRLSVTWTADGESEPRGGVTLHQPDPTERVRHVVRTPDGDYVLHIDADLITPLGTNEPPVETTLERRVSLKGLETVVMIVPETPRP